MDNEEDWRAKVRLFDTADNAIAIKYSERYQ